MVPKLWGIWNWIHSGIPHWTESSLASCIAGSPLNWSLVGIPHWSKLPVAFPLKFKLLSCEFPWVVNSLWLVTFPCIVMNELVGSDWYWYLNYRMHSFNGPRLDRVGPCHHPAVITTSHRISFKVNPLGRESTLGTKIPFRIMSPFGRVNYPFLQPSLIRFPDWPNLDLNIPFTVYLILTLRLKLSS